MRTKIYLSHISIKVRLNIKFHGFWHNSKRGILTPNILWKAKNRTPYCKVCTKIIYAYNFLYDACLGTIKMKFHETLFNINEILHVQRIKIFTLAILYVKTVPHFKRYSPKFIRNIFQLGRNYIKILMDICRIETEMCLFKKILEMLKNSSTCKGICTKIYSWNISVMM